MRVDGPTLGRQRGWLALVGIVLALVIVAVLAQSALRSYGLLGSAQPGATPGSRAPASVAPASVEAGRSASAVTAPLEKARGLEQQIQRDARDLDRHIDDQTK
jgi:hypothetical protein